MDQLYEKYLNQMMMIYNGLIKRPEYGKKKPLTKMSCYIGEFHRVSYQKM